MKLDEKNSTNENLLYKRYTTEQQAIIDMHERGFDSDFTLVGEDWLWVQEKTMVGKGCYFIVEHHEIEYHDKIKNSLVVFGLIALPYNVRGILINHRAGSSKNR